MRAVIYTITFFALGLGVNHVAQAQTDLELAEFYYNEGSYEQAKLYLVEIYIKKQDKRCLSDVLQISLSHGGFRSR